MKITWITARHPPNRGGMAISSQRITNNLKNRGCSVEIIHLQPPAHQIDSEFDHNGYLDNWNRHYISGINMPADPEKIFWMQREKMKDSFLIGFGGDYPGYLATLWGKWLNRPSIALFRGNDLEKTIHDGKRGWQVHYVLQHAGVVGAVSKEMVERIKSLRDGKTIFTPNSVDAHEWTVFDQDLYESKLWRKQMNLSDKPIVAVLGHLKEKKGMDFALNLFINTSLKESAYLLSIGDIPKNVTNSLQHECNFWIHVPYQHKDKLPMWYSIADIILIPSYYDGMPNVLLEAMAMGKIVIASKAGAIPDVIEHQKNGFLFNINDHYGAYELIEKVINMSDNKRKAIQENAGTTIQTRFCAEIECASLLEAVKYFDE